MKTLLIIGLVFVVGLPIRADSMGSINDPIPSTSTQPGTVSQRIAFLKAEIAEKVKIIKSDYDAAARSGGDAPHHAAYDRIIKADEAELATLQATR